MRDDKKKRGGIMRQREKRQKRQPESDRTDCVIRQPVTPEQRAEIERTQPKRGCYQCVFYVSNAMLWLQTLFSGFPVPGMCVPSGANTPTRPARAFGAPHTTSIGASPGFTST